MEKYIKSPKSHKQILIDGPAYKRLKKEGYDLTNIPKFKKPARKMAKKGDIQSGGAKKRVFSPFDERSIALAQKNLREEQPAVKKAIAKPTKKTSTPAAKTWDQKKWQKGKKGHNKDDKELERMIESMYCEKESSML